MIKSEQKLATRVLKSMTIRVSLIVLVSSILSYLHFYSNIEQSTIHTLEKYVNERTQREAFVFEQARKSHQFLKAHVENYLRGSINSNGFEKSFDKSFVKMPDGTFRNGKGYDGTKMAGLFIPPKYNLTDEKKKLFVFLRDTAETLGPAFRSNFQDTYFTTPDNVMIIFWPEVPNWTMEMKSDFDMTKEEYVWIADRKNNPNKKMVWTGLFYDKVGKVWMTSAETPVYHNGQHVLTIGHDIMLKELLERATTDSLVGAYNVIFREDGRLIVHPNKVKELKKHSGYFDINKNGNSFLKGLKKSILENSRGAKVVEHTDGKHLLAFGKINGPDWYFVVVYPRTLITSAVLKGIVFVIALAIMSLILEVVVIWLVLKKEVSEPIEELYLAAEKMRAGDFTTKVSLERKDELGAFASAFNTMSTAILQRDQKLQEHAVSLEKKVEERSLELDKQRVIAMESARLASLGEMAGGIAHEINNPLAIISMSTSKISKLIKRDMIDREKLIKACGDISNTIKRISKIITGLRTISRSDVEDHVEDILLSEVIDDVMGLCSEKMRINGVELTLKDSKSLVQKKFKCFRVQLSQVLLNLLNNASDAIEDNDEKWIVLEIDSNENFLVVTITDSGNGISKDVEQKMFQPFFTTKPIGKGTGLGLSLSKSLIEQQKGKLYIDHSCKNTRFVIELPKNDLKTS